MSEENHIDDLFRQKLAGRQVSYSEGSWSGAEQLLNRHYRWLFWKKLGLFAVPTLIATGVVAFSLLDSNTSMEPIAAGSTGIQNAPVKVEQAGEETTIATKAQTSTARTGQAEKQPDEVATGREAVREQASFHHASRQWPNTGEGAQTEGPGPAAEAVEAPGYSPTRVQQGPSQPVENGDPAMAHGSPQVSASAIKTTNLSGQRKHDDMLTMPWISISNLGNQRSDILDLEDADELSMTKARTWLLQWHGGVAWSSSLSNTGSPRDDRPLGAYTGLSLQWFFQPKVSLGLGATIHTRSGLNSRLTDDAGNIRNGMAVNYADISLDLRWNLIKRHTIGLGVAMAPLLNVYSEVETSNGASSRQFEREGFAEFDAAGMLYYQYMISQKFCLNASVRYGLFDITDDNHFRTEDVDDRNHQLRLGISYRIFQR